jgi:hypothetical protein
VPTQVTIHEQMLDPVVYEVQEDLEDVTIKVNNALKLNEKFVNLTIRRARCSPFAPPRSPISRRSSADHAAELLLDPSGRQRIVLRRMVVGIPACCPQGGAR